MIRKATLDDISKIMYVASIAFPSTYSKILTSGQIDYMMEMMYSERSIRKQLLEDGHEYFIYYMEDGDDSEPVGYVSISPDTPSIYHLQKIYVLPKFQKMGIGKKLFNYAVETMKKYSAQRMQLNVNRENPALGFYRSMGMRIQSEGDFPIGNGYFMQDYIMELDLK